MRLGYNAGTSMSSPLVAGVLATWLQARPEMTPEEARYIISQTSRSDDFANGLPNTVWGYGKIDALEGVKQALALPAAVESVKTSDNLHVLSLQNGKAEAVLSTTSDRAVLSLYSADGRLVMSQSAANLQRGDKITLNVSDLAAGSYILRLTADGEATILKALIF